MEVGDGDCWRQVEEILGAIGRCGSWVPEDTEEGYFWSPSYSVVAIQRLETQKTQGSWKGGSAAPPQSNSSSSSYHLRTLLYGSYSQALS